MGMWENLKGLASLGSNVVKTGTTAVKFMNKLNDRKSINYRVPNMAPESDELTNVENMYVAAMKSAIMKIVLEEYDSGRLHLEWLHTYIKNALETLVSQIEVNYKYRKDVLRLDFVGDNVDYYMNSAYFMKSDCYPFLTSMNKLLDQIKSDIKQLNDNSYKYEKSREKLLEILQNE